MKYLARSFVSRASASNVKTAPSQSRPPANPEDVKAFKERIKNIAERKQTLLVKGCKFQTCPDIWRTDRFFALCKDNSLDMPKNTYQWRMLDEPPRGTCVPDLGGILLMATDGLLAVVHNDTINKFSLVHLKNFEPTPKVREQHSVAHKNISHRPKTKRQLLIEEIASRY